MTYSYAPLPADPRAQELAVWLIEAGLSGQRNAVTLEAYCNRLVAMGVPLLRLHVTQSALHPLYGGLGFNWRRGEGAVEQEYEHSNEAPEAWLSSPFRHMLEHGLTRYREAIGPAPSRFPLLNDMRAQGATDYLAAAVAFDSWSAEAPLDITGHREGSLVSWMSDAHGGFSETDTALIDGTFPLLSLVLKTRANRKTAEDLLRVYLGRDAGGRVLSGEIQRGSSRWIDAVICYFDLQGFTSMSQQIPGEELIDLLNTYFGLVVDTIEAEGGDVLKFMGDGLIAIFDRQEMPDATDRALRATARFGQALDTRNAEREAAALPLMDFTAALHAGRVLYGNVGGDTRLDFTVIGPVVNLAARVSGMHGALGRNVIMTGDVVRDATPGSSDFVSLGRYMLRGVDRPKELYTIYEDPDRTRA